MRKSSTNIVIDLYTIFSWGVDRNVNMIKLSYALFIAISIFLSSLVKVLFSLFFHV